MKNALRDIGETARGLMRNWRAMMVFFAIYIALLATITLFVTTREATIGQVLLTFTTLIVAPALFFLLQTMCVSYAETTEVVSMLRRSVRNVWKLMLVSLPVILVAVALYLLLGKIEARVSPQESIDAARGEWPRLIFQTVRLLLFGIVLPLVNIHLWLALMHKGVLGVFGDIKGIISKAFAPRSVLTYSFGLVLFGVIPYFILVSRTPSERAWLEMTLLGARVVIAFGLMLLGWVITVGALHKGMSAER